MNQPQRSRRACIATLMSLLTTACVTTELTSAGAAVRVTMNPEVVRGCTFKSNVAGSDSMNGGAFGQSAANENAMRRLQNEAAAAGANTVILISNQTGFSGSIIRGEAYLCVR